MRPTLLWDLFCTVIDNHGDLGVCWRLARQLRDAGQRVRLWVDDASALAWMAPKADQEAGIALQSWQQAGDAGALQGLEPADVWIEAFGCNLPEAFIVHGVHQHPRQPLWINLEYLSAEDWVPRFHGLSSPVMSGPAKGWIKRFFYPGFTPQTGGLLREADLLERQRHFDRSAWRAAHGAAAGQRLISLFCYEPPALPALLERLTGEAHHLLVAPGRPLAAMQRALAESSAAPRWSALPYTRQDGFDEMLWACDLNFVRGEDSLVRALWAGQPFVWQIYPQADQAHHAKLNAFLDWLAPPPSLRRMHHLWNAVAQGDMPELDADTLLLWGQCAAAARQRLLTQGDLLGHLLGWAPA
ncbi:MAG: elongation factor P maturation arginine rhamnosyltransferase EarP [Betaproteobacteria bacterium]